MDLTGKTEIKLDLQTLAAQTFRKFSIQVGDGFTWCEENGGGGNTPQGTVQTVDARPDRPHAAPAAT